ncbi:MAG: tetratricopeptide repeat protein [Gemmataceae bacterium]|nr:tetratricopeptide repeat protein [Gemmataceae bacterium]
MATLRWNLLLAVLLLGGGGAWWWFSGPAVPAVPDFDPEGVEEPVVNALRKGQEDVRAEPRSAQKWGRLGGLFLAHMHPDKADICFQVARRLAPAEPRWPYFRGVLKARYDPVAAEKSLRESLAVAEKAGIPADERALPQFQLAELLIGEGELDEAQRLLDAIEAADELAQQRLSFDRGLIASRREEWEKARDLLVPVSALEACRQRASRHLAIAAARLGETEMAEKYSLLAASLPQDSDWPNPWIDGFSSLQVGRLARFNEIRAIEKEKDHAEVTQMLMQLQRETKNRDVMVNFSLGLNLAKINRPEEAEKAFRRALQLDPKLYRCHFMFASLQLQRAKEAALRGNRVGSLILLDEALKHARASASLGTTDGWAHYLLGEVLLHLDKNAEAVEALKRAVDGRPEQPQVHMHYGEALARTGNKEKALVHLKRAVEKTEAEAKQAGAPINPRPAQALAEWEAKWKKGK